LVDYNVGSANGVDLGYCRLGAATGTLVAKFAVLSGRDPQESPRRAIIWRKALAFD
jgi:hypothetical protein